MGGISVHAHQPKGVHAERWRHARGCGRFFNALRDTTTDHFLAFYKTGEAQPALADRLTARTARVRAMSAPAGGLRTASGGRIDRTQRLRFTFDGQSYEGLAGDTLASALLANGVHLIGRSFKYHRPRGILAAGSEEPNALVTVSRDAARVTPNLRATQVELYDGLVAESQNRWPSLATATSAASTIGCRRFSPPVFTTRPSCGRARRGNGCTSP